MIARGWSPILGFLCLTGCVVEVHSGEVKVRGDATQLAHADFTYNVDAWKPEISYHTLGSTSDLTIEQPRGGHTHIGDTTYIWDIQAANDIPLELIAHLGAGDARLDLSSLTMRRVEVEMGVGQLNMDLRGTPKHDFDVRIQGGVGEATIHLPKDVGIYATGNGGIGEIHTEGLRKQGDHWVNDAYDDAKVRIHLSVEGGIGQINLLVG
jgi:predicted membrane protein